MSTEVVQNISHLIRLIEGRKVKVRFLGELGGYEIAVSVDDIIGLYHETASRDHHLIARVVGNLALFSVGIPMTPENIARMMGTNTPPLH